MTPTAPDKFGRKAQAPLSLGERAYQAAALAPALARGPTLTVDPKATMPDKDFPPRDQPAPPAFLAHVQDILRSVTYPGLTWDIMYGEAHTYLRVHNPEGINNVTSEDEPWSGRWWRLSEHMTDSEIVGTAFKAIITALEHEARENFLYKGVAVYDAHLDVEELVKLRSSKGCLDVRG